MGRIRNGKAGRQPPRERTFQAIVTLIDPDQPELRLLVRGRAALNERGEISEMRPASQEQLAAGTDPKSPILAGKTSSFWTHKTVDELAAEQGVGPAMDWDSMVGVWPGEVDDGFEKWIEEMRDAQPTP